jgi:geranylgeranyl pyrophosphate synthase
MIHLLQHGGPEADALVRTIVQSRDVTPEQWSHLKALLAEHRCIEYAYSRAVEFGETAKRSLKPFPPTQEREALTALADFVLSRDR